MTWTPATSHNYNRTGEYSVSVEAVNAVGSVKREMTINVYGEEPNSYNILKLLVLYRNV